MQTNKTPIDLSIGYHNIEGIHSATFDCKLPYLASKFIHDIEVLFQGEVRVCREAPGRCSTLGKVLKKKRRRGRQTGGEGVKNRSSGANNSGTDLGGLGAQEERR